MKNDKNFQALLRESDPSNEYLSDIEKRPATANDSIADSNSQELLQALDDESEVKYIATKIKLTLMTNWGNRQLIGLTGENKDDLGVEHQKTKLH